MAEQNSSVLADAKEWNEITLKKSHLDTEGLLKADDLQQQKIMIAYSSLSEALTSPKDLAFHDTDFSKNFGGYSSVRGSALAVHDCLWSPVPPASESCIEEHGQVGPSTGNLFNFQSPAAAHLHTQQQHLDI